MSNHGAAFAFILLTSCLDLLALGITVRRLEQPRADLQSLGS